MALDRVVAIRIGTFACRTVERETKASKRANLCHAQELTNKKRLNEKD
jgi:hypothetical protein